MRLAVVGSPEEEVVVGSSPEEVVVVGSSPEEEGPARRSRGAACLAWAPSGRHSLAVASARTRGAAAAAAVPASAASTRVSFKASCE